MDWEYLLLTARKPADHRTAGRLRRREPIDG